MNALKTLTVEKQPDDIYMEFVNKLFKTVESRLILRVAMATKCAAWKSLPTAMQTNILQMGFFNPMDTKSVKNGSTKTSKVETKTNNESTGPGVRRAMSFARTQPQPLVRSTRPALPRAPCPLQRSPSAPSQQRLAVVTNNRTAVERAPSAPLSHYPINNPVVQRRSVANHRAQQRTAPNLSVPANTSRSVRF